MNWHDTHYGYQLDIQFCIQFCTVQSRTMSAGETAARPATVNSDDKVLVLSPNSVGPKSATAGSKSATATPKKAATDSDDEVLVLSPISVAKQNGAGSGGGKGVKKTPTTGAKKTPAKGTRTTPKK